MEVMSYLIGFAELQLHSITAEDIGVMLNELHSIRTVLLIRLHSELRLHLILRKVRHNDSQ